MISGVPLSGVIINTNTSIITNSSIINITIITSINTNITSIITNVIINTNTNDHVNIVYMLAISCPESRPVVNRINDINY